MVPPTSKLSRNDRSSCEKVRVSVPAVPGFIRLEEGEASAMTSAPEAVPEEDEVGDT